MGYRPSVSGNPESRSERDGKADPALSAEDSATQAAPIPERVIRDRSWRIAPAVAAILVLVVVAALVAKPWSPAPPGAASTGTGALASAAVGPTSAPDGSVAAPSPFVARGIGPIAPLDWSQISVSMSPLAMTQLGVVTRSTDGTLSSSVVLLEASQFTDVVTTPITTVGGRDVPMPNAIRLPSAGAVAVVLVQSSGQGPSDILVWQTVGPSSVVRIGARHPVGDWARDLWIYPPTSAPRGERRNLGEISAAPPTWPPGTYRFDLIDPAGVARHVFIIFEPDGTA